MQQKTFRSHQSEGVGLIFHSKSLSLPLLTRDLQLQEGHTILA